MNIQHRLEQKLTQRLDATHVEVVNESQRHNVPPGSESHFKITVVASDFEGQDLLAQHRLIYSLLDAEIQAGIHALALHTYTEAAWNKVNQMSPDSPRCLGTKTREIDAD